MGRTARLEATLALALSPALSAFHPPQPGPDPGASPFTRATSQEGSETDEIDRLTEWPELESKGKTDKEISRLRKARTEEMGLQAAEALVEMGAGAAPLLIKALGKEKGEEARERLVALLDRLCGDAHTRLLAEEFEHKSAVVREWALTRVAWTPDEGVRGPAEAALARALEVEEPDRQEQAELLAAALCATSTGSLAGLDVLYAEALEDWAGSGPRIRRALEVVRGPDAAARFWERIGDGDREGRIAAIRMLAGCGERDRARDLIPMLDDSDNSIRVAAINALRGIVDGEPPLEKLATFTAIEKALEWKQRL